jgi:hypothetical protein
VSDGRELQKGEVDAQAVELGVKRTSTASASAMKLSTSLGSYSTSTWCRDTEEG